MVGSELCCCLINGIADINPSMLGTGQGCPGRAHCAVMALSAGKTQFNVTPSISGQARDGFSDYGVK